MLKEDQEMRRVLSESLQAMRVGRIAARLAIAFAMLSPVVFAQGVEGFEPSVQAETAGGGDAFSVRREQFGSTRVVQVFTFSPTSVNPYLFTANDEMLLKSVFVDNGSFFLNQSFTEGAVRITTAAGILYFVYLDRFGNQSLDFKPPIRVGAGARIEFFPTPGTNDAFLQVTALGTVDSTVFEDRFEE
jgi:hypothetical protein